MREGIEDYDKRHGWRGPITNKVSDKNGKKKVKQFKLDPTLNWRFAVINNINEEEITFKTLNQQLKKIIQKMAG